MDCSRFSESAQTEPPWGRADMRVGLAGHQISEPLANKRAELESMTGRARADHYVADSVDDEVSVGGVVVYTPFHHHRMRVEARQEPPSGPLNLLAQPCVLRVILPVGVHRRPAEVHADLVLV